MRFQFTVEAEAEKTSGPFVSREEISEQIQEALESADPGTYEGSNGGEYESSEWSVSEVVEAKRSRKQEKSDQSLVEKLQARIGALTSENLALKKSIADSLVIE